MDENLKAFILEAKANQMKCDCSTDDESGAIKFSHTRSGYEFYAHGYSGKSSFSAIETVLKDGKPVWSMTYSGSTSKEIDNELFGFLAQCLKIGNETGCLRGPMNMSINDYSYSFYYEPPCGKTKIAREQVFGNDKAIIRTIILINENFD